MKAIGYTQPSETVAADSLQEYEVDIPVATARDLLVEVKAVSVNPVDTKLRGRINPAPNMKILGYDAVGTVKAVGDNVSLFKVGDRVFYAGDMTRQGSNAQYQLVDERIVGFAPKSISDAQAAALPLTAVTAWELLFDRLQLDNDSTQSLLVIGAAGGVGSILLQLAKQLTNVTIIATASRDKSADWVRKLGADHVINYRRDLNWGETARALTGGRGVDHIIEVGGPATLEQSMIAIRVAGHISVIGILSGVSGAMNFVPALIKQVRLQGVLVGSRSQQQDMIRAINANSMRPIIDRHFPLSEIVEAFKYQETNQHFGKICLDI